MEGIAELLGTHRWQDGQLRVGYFPQAASEVPGLGRIMLVQDDVAAGHALGVDDIFAYDNRAHMKVDAYAWSWALAAFLNGHPRYHDRFRQAAAFVEQGDFYTRFRALLAADWRQMTEEWQVFVANLDDGYDFERMAIDFRAGKPLVAEGETVTVAADRGWQSSGVYVESGQRYVLRAKGRYQIGRKPAAWWCEPGGVTIRYYHGHPLGMLLSAVVPDAPSSKALGHAGSASNPLVQPIAVGLEAVLAPTQSGTVYFRINEPAGELADNEGELAVQIAAGDAPEETQSGARSKEK
jgi:hypothetical protein